MECSARVSRLLRATEIGNRNAEGHLGQQSPACVGHGPANTLQTARVVIDHGRNSKRGKHRRGSPALR